MRRSILFLVGLPILLSATSELQAQVLPGELLVNSWSQPDALVHLRPDGTLGQTADQGTGSHWTGAAVLPDSDWCCARRQPPGVNLFDAATGVEVFSFDTPGIGLPGDVGVFSDGTIAVLDTAAGRLWRFDRAGHPLASYTLPGAQEATTLWIDAFDHMWIGDVKDRSIQHLNPAGAALGKFSLPFDPGDIVMADDGTLWMTMVAVGGVAQFDQSGTQLTMFKATGQADLSAIGLDPDGTLWVTGGNEKQVLHFATDGTLLGTLDVGPAGHPLYMTVRHQTSGPIGQSYCGPANLNSTGMSAEIRAWGDVAAVLNQVTLTAAVLPPDKFGYFVTSQTQGFVPFPGASQGNLCLGGAIGRYRKDIASSGAAGEIELVLDLLDTPTPGGSTTILAGQTWNWQCWFRDVNPTPTSNFTDGLSITFL